MPTHGVCASRPRRPGPGARTPGSTVSTSATATTSIPVGTPEHVGSRTGRLKQPSYEQTRRRARSTCYRPVTPAPTLCVGRITRTTTSRRSASAYASAGRDWPGSAPPGRTPSRHWLAFGTSAPARVTSVDDHGVIGVRPALAARQAVSAHPLPIRRGVSPAWRPETAAPG
jgi:hypothetical protein